MLWSVVPSIFFCEWSLRHCLGSLPVGARGTYWMSFPIFCFHIFHPWLMMSNEIWILQINNSWTLQTANVFIFAIKKKTPHLRKKIWKKRTDTLVWQTFPTWQIMVHKKVCSWLSSTIFFGGCLMSYTTKNDKVKVTKNSNKSKLLLPLIPFCHHYHIVFIYIWSQYDKKIDIHKINAYSNLPFE